MTIKWDPKDPDDIDVFTLDWSPRLTAPEAIVLNTWVSTPTGLTHGAVSASTNMSTIFLSGGVDGEIYDLTNTITTTTGRKLDQTVRLPVKTR